MIFKSEADIIKNRNCSSGNEKEEAEMFPVQFKSEQMDWNPFVLHTSSISIRYGSIFFLLWSVIFRFCGHLVRKIEYTQTPVVEIRSEFNLGNKICW